MKLNRLIFIHTICLVLLFGCTNNEGKEVVAKNESNAIPTKVLTKEEAILWMKENDKRPIQAFTSPTEADIQEGEKGDRIRQAIDLLTRTSEFMGKNAVNPEKRFSANNLNCTHCHGKGDAGLPGTQEGSLPWVNVINDYPKFDPKSMRIISLEERIIGMYGRGAVQLTPETEEMQIIMEYMRWLNQKAKPGYAMEGTGIQHIYHDQVANRDKGKALYETKCIACHGPEGLGIEHLDFAEGMGYVYPPVAGGDTYDDGGHVYMIPTLASMIYTNMPYGIAKPGKPDLTVEEAYDIAAYINHDLERRHNPNRTKSYPEPYFRPDAFVIPEHFDNDEANYLKAKFGPYEKPYGVAH